MKLSAIFLFFLTAFVASAEETPPEYVELEGKFKFNMRDSSGKLHFDSYIKSPSELVSASACTLQVTADDDYYNTYPIEINLFTVKGEVVPFIQAKALYIDENSRYWNKEIQSASFSVADIKVSEKTWHKDSIKGNYMLLSPNLDVGQLAFHHITMGQPLKVELTKQGKPSQVTINVPPLTAEVASFARKCLKLIDVST
jgi:hypothetical protein